VTERTSRPDYVLLATVGSLVALGLVMVYSASFIEAFRDHENQYYYLVRQTIGAIIGTIGMLAAIRIDYRIWRRYSVHLMGAALLLLFLVLILPDSLTRVNNSRSWIRFGEGVLGLVSVQPAELAKLAIIIYFADWLSRRSEKLGNVTYGLIPFSVMLGLVCGLVMLQPDLGTTVVLVLIGGVIYFAAGANLWHVAGAATLAAGAFWFMVFVMGVRNYRILAFLDPWKYYDTFGFQPIHAMLALGSGGIFGQGLGQARQKFQWLPQAYTDTIFAIIGEELGLIGTLAVMAAFVVVRLSRFSHRRARAQPLRRPGGRGCHQLDLPPGAAQYRGDHLAVALHRVDAAVSLVWQYLALHEYDRRRHSVEHLETYRSVPRSGDHRCPAPSAPPRLLQPAASFCLAGARAVTCTRPWRSPQLSPSLGPATTRRTWCTWGASGVWRNASWPARAGCPSAGFPRRPCAGAGRWNWPVGPPPWPPARARHGDCSPKCGPALFWEPVATSACRSSSPPAVAACPR
jgi:cell division protein FtsW